MPFHWPNGIETRLLLEKLYGKVATFSDESTRDVDVIILCTGYQHTFPFMEQKLQLKTANRLWIDKLQGYLLERKPSPRVHWNARPVAQLQHV